MSAAESWDWKQDAAITAGFTCGNVISNVGLFIIFQFLPTGETAGYGSALGL